MCPSQARLELLTQVIPGPHLWEGCCAFIELQAADHILPTDLTGIMMSKGIQVSLRVFIREHVLL